MKRVWLVIAAAALLVGCSSAQPKKAAEPVQEAPPTQVTAKSPIEPAVRLTDEQVFLPEGLSGTIPQGAYAAGYASPPEP